jgi:CPA1 family monovalent cation:H+ antiporter
MPGGETLSILEIFVVLVAAATVVAIVARRTILPYSVGLVFLGLAVSALQPPLDLEIAPDVLLAVLIPGLIFEAASRIDLR